MHRRPYWNFIMADKEYFEYLDQRILEFAHNQRERDRGNDHHFLEKIQEDGRCLFIGADKSALLEVSQEQLDAMIKQYTQAFGPPTPARAATWAVDHVIGRLKRKGFIMQAQLQFCRAYLITEQGEKALCEMRRRANNRY